MSTKELLIMLVAGLAIALLVINLSGAFKDNNVVLKGTSETESGAQESQPEVASVRPEGVSDNISNDSSSDESGDDIPEVQIDDIERRYREDLAASENRIERLEKTIADLLEEREGARSLDSETQTPPPVPESDASRRHAVEIVQVLDDSDAYFQEGRYAGNEHARLVDRVMGLYKIKGLSGEQNQDLKTCFRRLIDQEIEHVSVNLKNLRLDEAKKEVDRLLKIANLRIDGRPWLTQKQAAQVLELNNRLNNSLRESLENNS